MSGRVRLARALALRLARFRHSIVGRVGEVAAITVVDEFCSGEEDVRL